MFDIIIIGGGIVGCTTARELSKYDIKVALIEKESELSMGASKANSGIVHAGYDCEENSLKAKLNREGNFLYNQLAQELEIPLIKNGSIVLAFSENDKKAVEKLYERGIKNKIPELKIITKEELVQKEPNISDDVICALFAPTGGIISPYEATQAFAENAFANGVEFFLENEVINISKEKNIFTVKTTKNIFTSKIIINCAGIYSDFINNMLSEIKYKITPRKGEYMLFDKSLSGFINSTIFQVPSEFGKGVLVTPTVHGNLLIGPSSEFISDKEDRKTHIDILNYIEKTSLRSIKYLQKNKLITSFVGLRSSTDYEDFIIEESKDCSGLINAIGINSPGLSAAPAIAVYIKNIVSEIIELSEKKCFISKRKAITFIRDLDITDQNKLIEQNNLYGKIICRCETVTEAEIIDAITRPLGAKTLDGVKRMTRALGGRCQGGFCSSKILEILSKQLNQNVTEITKHGGESNILGC